VGAGTGDPGAYKDTVPACRNGVRKAKALLELNRERDGKETW